MGIDTNKSLSITISGKDLDTLFTVLQLGRSRLELVNETNWGKKLPEAIEFCETISGIITQFDRVGR